MPYVKILVLYLLFLLSCYDGLGQYNTPQNKVWVFGANAGLDFNSGAPVPVTTSITGNNGGSAMVCDAGGGLLFYTNGKTVWNKQHNVMPGGNAIVPFNTYLTMQPTVIVPVLGSIGQYYIFSLENSRDHSVTSRSHLAYSIVDMSLAGGLGDVTVTKGVVIDSLLSEKMVVVAGNNCDFWLMVYKRYASVFLSYHITIAGIDPVPVVSPGIGGEDSIGVMKISPDRRLLVKVNFGNAGSNTALCNFDAATGHVSGCAVISTGGFPSGAEFSSNNSKLYIADTALFQYDISLPGTAAIIASRYDVGGLEADLKLAPDGRIYASERTVSPSRYLDCIRNPDLGGAACNHIYQEVDVFPGTAGYGLPATYWSPIAGVAPGLITGDTAVCVGAEIILSNAIAGGVWTSSNTAIATVSTGGTVSGVTPGLAIIDYSNGCGVSSATVTVNPTPLLAPLAATVCIGSSIMLSFGPAGGTWSESVTGIVTVHSDGAVLTDNVGATVVTYTLPGNCFSITSIAVNELPVISPASVSLCANDITTLSYTPAGGVWSTSASGIATADAVGVVHGISGGSAVVSYSLGGCAAASTVTVQPAPDLVPGYSHICVGSFLQLSSSVAGGVWSSSSGAVASVSSSGNVQATGVGSAIISYAAIGCVGLATVVVRPPPLAISGRSLLCRGYSIRFSDEVAGGTWSSASTSVAVIDATGNAVGVAAGSTLISYTTAAGAGCTTMYSVTVIASAAAGSVTGPAMVCVGSSIALSDAVTGGAWSSEDIGVATITAPGVVSGVAQGTVTISYTVTDTCGVAMAFKTIVVDVPPDAGVITGDSVICMGSTVLLSNITSGGDWYSANSAIASVSAGGVVTGAGEGVGLIGYYVSNGCGSDTAWLPIRVAIGPPVSAISGLSYVCIGATFPLSNSTGGGTWSASAAGVIALSTGGHVSAVGQGIRIISYTIGPDANGCYGTATHSVTVTTVATFSVTPTVAQPLCYGDTTGAISLTVAGVSPPYKFLWSTMDNGASLLHLASGTYFSLVTEAITNCYVPDTFHIVAPSPLSLALIVAGDVCNAGKGRAYADVAGGTAPYSYTWSTGSQANDITGLHAGIYPVSAADLNGCIITGTAVIADTCSVLNIHDVITPNGDGINDTWVIEGLDMYPANTVQVFDKWGDLLYEKKSYQNDWNGIGKNGALPDGTYYYLLKLNGPNMQGRRDSYTGYVLIKR